MGHDNLAGATVVVGVDSSDPSLASVRLAAREAALRRRTLVILHAVEPPVKDQVDADADRLIDAAVAVAREVEPGLEIRTDVAVSSPAAALLRSAEDAALIVVGAHGDSGASGLMTGSTAVQVAVHASCPALISRGQPAPGGEIVLGVDGSPRSASAVAFAFDEAALTGTNVHAVHAWHHPIVRGGGDSLPRLYTDGDVELEEARLLAEAVSGWGEKYPDVTVRTTLVRGRAANALVEASVGASLLVVGARGSGGFAELLLGSVGLRLIHRSTCPIAIVRPGVHTIS
ncbi:MAG TPA: universal stress protein [Micromonosporaceae bacterium]|jgi:nucleotide-binding universal stress UspA family protein